MILVVEDDALLQDIVEEALREGGFETALVTSGEEAVTLLRGGQINYRGLATDINLRGKIGGRQIARGARDINPLLPVVYMTGLAADEWASQGVPNSILLEKPFAPAQLVTAISRFMNAATGSGT